MDRPLGPRQPDKRNTAYESIFGRPSAIHHQSQGYQQYPPHRNSYASSLPLPPPPPPHQVQPPYRQQFYQQQPNYGYQDSLSPPSVHSRERSIGGSAAGGIIVPQPEFPPDATLEPLTRAGYTPAQAYQAQIYMNSSESNWARHSVDNSSFDSARAPSPMLPQVQSSNGRLDIDFGLESTDEFDESGSELPWASHRPLSSAPPLDSAGVSSRPYPLQLSTVFPSIAPSSSFSISESPASSTSINDLASGSATSPRRSSESTRTLPRPSNLRRERTVQDRSKSMSATTSQAKSMMDLSRLAQPNKHQHPHVPRPRSPTSRRTPIVYPALLSRVAEAFRTRVPVSERVKDGLTYTDAFDGREAVDKIAYIIKTTDRNLALLLGRALDAQKFFHDVTYDHRLRDSVNELYQFRTKLPSPFVSGEIETADDVSSAQPTQILPGTPLTTAASTSAHTVLTEDSATLVESALGHETGAESESAHTHPPRDSVTADDLPLPSGVFTLLTDCYSPTCSRDSLCYSIACPRRPEQQARLNMKPQPGLKKQISRESLGDFVEPGTLWIHSVSEEIVKSVSDTEKKRQEAINEVMYTERDFVRDMEYLRDVWINPLRASDIIPEARRTDFLEQVFWNIRDIIAVNTRLRDSLSKRQKSYAVVERIGDIFLDAVPHFEPFVSYGSHQLYGKYEFEREKTSNPAFMQFVDETERLPISRKLELNGYLTKPTTRLARYPLLLDAVLKHTPDDNPDKQTLPQVIVLVREFLAKVNIETGKTENRFNLLQLDQQLVFRPADKIDLRLTEDNRELVFKGALNKRGGTQGEAGDLQVFLFDHALLMVKQKSKHEMFKVYRRPIPLELLLIAASSPDDAAAARLGPRSSRNLIRRNSFTRSGPHAVPVVPSKPDAKGGYSITFVHLGRKYYQITLWASTYITQKKWVEHITKQQEIMRERSMIFETVTLSEGFFQGPNRVNCATPFHGGRRMAYGTDDGVYFSDLYDRNREPVRVLALMEVAQVDVLEEYQLLIVLSERQVITFPLEALDPMDPLAGLKRAKRVSSHTSFFKAGVCLGKTLVSVVKASALSSTIKTLEPIDQNVRGKNKPTFRKLLQGGNDTLRVFKEFYIPVESKSIHYLKTRLCIGCTKGFEIVDLETLDTQALLDSADTSLDFVQKDGVRPIAMYRIDSEFLLCYNEFAFYINRNGWRARRHFMVHWEGSPTAFALHYPYVLAFDTTFVEIRHVETGYLSQVIQGNNLRCLFADTPPSMTQTAAPMYHQGYHPGGPPLPPQTMDPYGEQIPSGGYGGRQSMYSQYTSPSPYPEPSLYQQRSSWAPASSRDEIVMVSDDRVMTLRMTQPTAPMSDAVSMHTIPMPR